MNDVYSQVFFILTEDVLQKSFMGNMGILPLRETFTKWKKIQSLLFSVYIRKK